MSPKAGADRAAPKSAPDWNRNQVVLPTLLLLLYSRQINPKPENLVFFLVRPVSVIISIRLRHTLRP
jgi:hypothetical protein